MKPLTAELISSIKDRVHVLAQNGHPISVRIIPRDCLFTIGDFHYAPDLTAQDINGFLDFYEVTYSAGQKDAPKPPPPPPAFLIIKTGNLYHLYSVAPNGSKMAIRHESLPAFSQVACLTIIATLHNEFSVSIQDFS